ncbi:ell-associated factor Eaf [Drosophila elegans]|uniref:ell-associated factor Eaf n=1 Tax=Drosophila elegans TaxID=30023 RepID=UPI0007E6328F|nr:ell-associated factor Eaf [Drosophila elegans]XP_041563069.1 ell-associated factor Eaf [Drosophila elegans]
MMMTKQKNSLAERLNIGEEVRELKLGATFNPKNTSTAFHTIKYDFKPASVDTSRMASVDVGSNNQVTVIVPNSESSGVPHTVYKGNQREYAKECLMIYDKETGAITIEKLHHNIQVKKTRSEVTNKPVLLPAQNVPVNMGHSQVINGAGGAPISVSGHGSGSAPKMENSTMRISSKTKVSTGSRRNNIIDFKPRNSPMQQSSPSRPVPVHRSPQSAPAWDANNAQQTLPSIPMITDDDDFGLRAALHSSGQANTSGSSTGSAAGQPDFGSTTSSSHMGKQRQAPQHGHGKRQQMHHRASPPMAQQQQHHQQPSSYGRGFNGGHNHAQQQQHQQQQQRHSPQQHHLQRPSAYGHGNSMPMDLDANREHELTSQSVAQAAAALEQQIGGALSASSSSSESDSSDSDSGSDSDDSTEDDRPMQRQQSEPEQHHHQQQQQQAAQVYQNQHHQQQQQQMSQQHLNQLPNLGLGSISPAYGGNHQQQQQMHHQQHHQQQKQQSGNYASNGGFPNDLLQNDLQLSSNSSDDDDD